MFVGLLFYIPEQDERRIRNSEFSASSGGRNLEVVVVIIIVAIVIVALHEQSMLSVLQRGSACSALPLGSPAASAVQASKG